MGQLQYKVMYRYTHPITKTPIQNKYADYVPYGVVMEGVTLNNTSAAAPKRKMTTFNYGTGTTLIGDKRDPSIRPELSTILGPTNSELDKQIELKFIEKRNNSANHMYDSLFYYDSTRQVYTFVREAENTVGSSNPVKNFDSVNFDLYADLFKQVTGEPWFVHSVHGSFNAALESAKKLANNIGLSNVDLVKRVPLGTQMIIE